jgi:hypothetical protein
MRFLEWFFVKELLESFEREKGKEIGQKRFTEIIRVWKKFFWRKLMKGRKEEREGD